jgi:MFS family permease
MFGKLYNIFPIKTIFLVSAIIFEIGSLIAATATVSDALILGRAISGFGSGGIVAGCFTSVFPSYSRQYKHTWS